MAHIQTTIRLTVRPPEELDKMLRAESIRRGTNINQTMLYRILDTNKSIWQMFLLL